ncbi:Hst3 protein [Colletotrichum higginsianum]|nr:Hst3 protein [Colletotrichum higginsianum]
MSKPKGLVVPRALNRPTPPPSPSLKVNSDLIGSPTAWSVSSYTDLWSLCGVFCAPECPYCAGATAARQERGKRALGVGKLRPDIVLYGEEHPNAHLISPIITHDLGLSPDLLLILGTSLKVHGLKVLVREFAKTIHSRGGKVVFVNYTKPPESSWGDIIDYWVQWDCDAWVSNLKERIPLLWLPPGTKLSKKKKESSDKPKKRQNTAEQGSKPKSESSKSGEHAPKLSQPEAAVRSEPPAEKPEPPAEKSEPPAEKSELTAAKPEPPTVKPEKSPNNVTPEAPIRTPLPQAIPSPEEVVEPPKVVDVGYEKPVVGSEETPKVAAAKIVNPGHGKPAKQREKGPKAPKTAIPKTTPRRPMAVRDDTTNAVYLVFKVMAELRRITDNKPVPPSSSPVSLRTEKPKPRRKKKSAQAVLSQTSESSPQQHPVTTLHLGPTTSTVEQEVPQLEARRDTRVVAEDVTMSGTAESSILAAVKVNPGRGNGRRLTARRCLCRKVKRPSAKSKAALVSRASPPETLSDMQRAPMESLTLAPLRTTGASVSTPLKLQPLEPVPSPPTGPLSVMSPNSRLGLAQGWVIHSSGRIVSFMNWLRRLAGPSLGVLGSCH